MKNLIVVSFDALSSEDYNLIKTLPNSSIFFKEGAYAKEVSSIYPSLTYPAHCSIITGRKPYSHGIINNTLIQPGKDSPDWHWFSKDIKGETLIDKAFEANMTVAALLWPVTAGNKAIKYNMPEIFPNRW